MIAEEIERLRGLSYDELSNFMTTVAREIRGPSGTIYNREVYAVFDDRRSRNLRVIVSVDDGGWRSIVPLTDDFIIAPDGRFVGE